MAMKRRDFLRATLVTAGAIFAPAACSDEGVVGDPVACPVEESAALFPQSVASGDPRADSVILWTRVEDPAATGDVHVELQVALDEAFQQVVSLTLESARRSVIDDVEGASLVSVVAEARFDNCVKVKVAGLQPGTTYYYRFFYKSGETCYASRIGRTKTAPAADADVPVRFAYVSCQDFIGRYYNSHVALAQEELDFVVFLGDYVYETTGDPSFQTESDTRKLTFVDEAGAIALTTAEGQTFHAARSLSNYRDLYRTYRGDLALQAVHERFPAIVIWDDHEYSDDCHGATATYLDGQADETDVDRRKAANQAWFEYMPVDYAAGDEFAYDPAAEYPNDIAIYRHLTFGKHLHLVLTDLRSYRADHLIPEDAFPGKVIADEATLTAELGALPAFAAPYVDIDAAAYADYKQALTAAAETIGYRPEDIAGNLSVVFINQLVTAINDPALALIDPATAGLKRGIAYVDMAKTGFYTAIGSRYFAVRDTFDVHAKLQWDATQKESEVMMGEAQESWFLETLSGSTSTWKVWANEYCLVQLSIDLSEEETLPPQFRQRYYMNLDCWDGFRNRRSALLEQLSALDNVVAITGDIHGFYAGTPMVNDDPTKKIVEIVGSSVSSKTFKEELKSQVASDPVLSQLPGASLLASLIDSFLTNPNTRPNPQLGYANSGANGFCVAEVSADELVVTMHQIPSKEVESDYLGREAELLPLVEKVQFKAVSGEKELYWYDDAAAAWKKWDPTAYDWV